MGRGEKDGGGGDTGRAYPLFFFFSSSCDDEVGSIAGFSGKKEEEKVVVHFIQERGGNKSPCRLFPAQIREAVLYRVFSEFLYYCIFGVFGAIAQSRPAQIIRNVCQTLALP